MAEKGKTIRLEVITPDAAVLNEDVEFVLVRALDGDLGIMPNHAPLIASLDICPLMYMNNPLSGKMPVITCSNKLRTYTTARYYTEDELLAKITGGEK